ncbi:MAG: BatD family protein [Kiritimatiellae bacterium]|nr:BatD family protein [Kiritimatiellia bacterium]
MPFAGAVLALLLLCPAARGQDFAVEARVETTECFLGESFQFQIQVSGSNNPDQPDVTHLSDEFTVEGPQGQDISRSFRMNINGRVTERVERGYVFHYLLTPKRAGVLKIRPIEVRAEGQTGYTPLIPIQVKTPQEHEHFKLELGASKTTCYVGEPITLRLTWHEGAERNKEKFDLNYPALRHEAFSFPEEHVAADAKVIRDRATGLILPYDVTLTRRGGREFKSFTFRKVAVPLRAGTFELPPATAVCEVLKGYRRVRDDFFPIMARNQPVYEKIVVPSHPLTLRVEPLPQAGRPPNFAGLVGRYEIRADATPREVSVGDPITLTLAVSGSEYLDNVKLPPLHRQEALARDFKIPTEMADGTIEGNRKVFTQTIRAMDARVREVPAIDLPYFDTEAGEYRVARTQPVPLTVHETKVVTARDAEGLEPTAAGSSLEAWSKGIVANYEGPDVLEDHRFGPAAWGRSPGWILLIGFPPLAYFALLAFTVVVRRQYADPMAVRARKAYGNATRALADARARTGAGDPQGHALVLNAITAYLAARLRRPAGVLTFRDVEGPLQRRGVEPDTLAGLKRLFEQCEAGRYAGASLTAADVNALIDQAGELAGRLEKRLK